LPRLVPLPLSTFSDVAALGLELHVWCPGCKATRPVDVKALHARRFPGSRFRCARCDSPGRPKVRPAVLLPVGGADRLAFPWCNACNWEAGHLPIDQEPWNVVNRAPGDRFACPGCRRAVQWHIHGPTWRPSYVNR
jgi:hypothetical protein